MPRPAPRRSTSRSRPKKVPLARDLLARLRAICLALPGTEQVEAWGHPTFRVRGKIFATFGGEGPDAQMSVKCTHEMQASLVSSDPRFSIAHYVGKHGWVTLNLGKKVDWGEIEALVRESYRQIAPARLVASLPPGP